MKIEIGMNTISAVGRQGRGRGKSLKRPDLRTRATQNSWLQAPFPHLPWPSERLQPPRNNLANVILTIKIIRRITADRMKKSFVFRQRHSVHEIFQILWNVQSWRVDVHGKSWRGYSRRFGHRSVQWKTVFRILPPYTQPFHRIQMTIPVMSLNYFTFQQFSRISYFQFPERILERMRTNRKLEQRGRSSSNRQALKLLLAWKWPAICWL